MICMPVRSHEASVHHTHVPQAALVKRGTPGSRAFGALRVTGPACGDELEEAGAGDSTPSSRAWGQLLAVGMGGAFQVDPWPLPPCPAWLPGSALGPSSLSTWYFEHLAFLPFPLGTPPPKSLAVGCFGAITGVGGSPPGPSPLKWKNSASFGSPPNPFPSCPPLCQSSLPSLPVFFDPLFLPPAAQSLH